MLPSSPNRSSRTDDERDGYRLSDSSFSLVPIITFDGLPELARSLKEIDRPLLEELKDELEEVGEIVRVEAFRRFTKGVARNRGRQWTAENFQVRVRAGGHAKAILVVAQRLPKKTGKRPDYGALQMTEALLPAREAKMMQAEAMLQDRVLGLLKGHGYA